MSDADEQQWIDAMKEVDPTLAELMATGDLAAVQAYARAQLTAMAPPEGTPAVAEFGSPYAVICREHGRVLLTEDEYTRQLCKPDALWRCPKCGDDAQFDDVHYETMLGISDRDD